MKAGSFASPEVAKTSDQELADIIGEGQGKDAEVCCEHECG
jgi:hypothetical protein